MIKSKIWIGIDPGKSGCLCCLFEDNSATFTDWPKSNSCHEIYPAIRLAIQGHEVVKAGLEKVSAMPGQGVKSMFSFGENNGMWKMLLAVLRIPYYDPTPQAWQKSIVRKSDHADPKQRAYLAAVRLYPDLIANLKGPQGGLKDGRVDALLIAHFIKGEGK